MIQVVKKHSLKGFWHWLRYKEVKRKKITQLGDGWFTWHVNEYEYVFIPRRWWKLLVGEEQS